MAGFARPRAAHRNVERKHERAATGGFGAADKIEPDRMAVVGEAIKLKPKHVGREFADFFDRGAADRAQRVRNARALRGSGKIGVGARPDNRRPAHRCDSDGRTIAAAE